MAIITTPDNKCLILSESTLNASYSGKRKNIVVSQNIFTNWNYSITLYTMDGQKTIQTATTAQIISELSIGPGEFFYINGTKYNSPPKTITIKISNSVTSPTPDNQFSITPVSTMNGMGYSGALFYCPPNAFTMTTSSSNYFILDNISY